MSTKYKILISELVAKSVKRNCTNLCDAALDNLEWGVRSYKEAEAYRQKAEMIKEFAVTKKDLRRVKIYTTKMKKCNQAGYYYLWAFLAAKEEKTSGYHQVLAEFGLILPFDEESPRLLAARNRMKVGA